MITSRRSFLRGLGAAFGAAALPMPSTMVVAAPAMVKGPQAPPVHAGQRSAGLQNASQQSAWAPVGPSAEIRRLFAPASGALFAASASALFRSDDGGTTWQTVELPVTTRKQRAITVDPTNHRTIYVECDDGLQRSTDDAATWTTILPTDRQFRRVVVSPADPRILYVEQRGASDSDNSLLFSPDQGATWENRNEQHNSLCGWGILILTPHPTDPARLFRTAGCYAGRDLSDSLDESRDNAATFKPLFSPKGAFPQVIVGGGGAEPTRFYLAADNDARSGGSSLFVSTDDGATWTSILSYTGGGTTVQPKTANITMSALTYDPVTPSRAFVALGSQGDSGSTAVSGGILATTDGGTTWGEIGTPEMPRVDDLALGIDGQNLYAATSTGVWRLPLSRALRVEPAGAGPAPQQIPQMQ
jgi:photosystem II stability/assembly factor-like uncharacterized protein